jgi:hypothetical protein
LSVDGSWRASTVAREHRCTAVSPPAVLAAEKQRRLCLVTDHVDCATYIAAQSARETAADAMVGRGPQRPMPRTSPIVLDHGRFGVTLPGMPDRGVGQGGLVALMAVAFGALAVGRLTGGGPDVTPAGGAGAGSARPSAIGTPAAATTRPSTSEASPASGPGRTLVPSDVEPTPGTPQTTPVASTSGSTYKVKSGDTLSGIAADHGTTWQVIAQLNKITDPSKLHVGQVLLLP